VPVAGYSQNANNLSEQQVRGLEAIATTLPVGTDGKQTVDFAVSGDDRGYTPSVLKVKKGVPVHLNVSIAGSDPGCGRLITFRGLDAKVVAHPGQIVPLDFTPTSTGIYEINCGMSMMQPGYVLVTDS